jgi:hypothetical protein
MKIPYCFFRFYFGLPTNIKMNIYWWAMRTKRFQLAWNLADHTTADEDNFYYLLKLASQAYESGEIS